MEVDAAVGIDHKFRIENAGDQILDVQGVHLAAIDVQRIGKLIAIRADRQGADAAKGLSLCQQVLIEQDLFGVTRCIFPAAVDGILLAGFVAGVIEIRAAFLRDSDVCFLDARLHLGIKLFLEGLGMTHDLFEVVVFCV
jgi:hypothetical protein